MLHTKTLLSIEYELTFYSLTKVILLQPNQVYQRGGVGRSDPLNLFVLILVLQVVLYSFGSRVDTESESRE